MNHGKVDGVAFTQQKGGLFRFAVPQKLPDPGGADGFAAFRFRWDGLEADPGFFAEALHQNGVPGGIFSEAVIPAAENGFRIQLFPQDPLEEVLGGKFPEGGKRRFDNGLNA